MHPPNAINQANRSRDALRGIRSTPRTSRGGGGGGSLALASPLGTWSLAPRYFKDLIIIVSSISAGGGWFILRQRALPLIPIITKRFIYLRL